MVARCDDPPPAASSLRTRIQPILFVLVLFVLLFCSPVVALSTRLPSVVVCFFPLFLWYSLAFRGSPSLSPSSSLRGIVSTVRYVLDLWIIW